MDRSLNSEHVSTASAALLTQYPMVFQPSPDSELFLTKAFGDRDFHIALVRRSTGETIAAHRAFNSQVAAAWRHDSGALAFLSDSAGNQRYQPYVMDVRSGETRRTDLPPTTVSRAIKWSPTTSKLAYLVRHSRTGPYNLIVADPTDTAGTPIEVAQDLLPRAGFAWSPDSKLLAVVSRHDPESVQVIDTSGSLTTRLPVASAGEVRDITWSPDGRTLLVTHRGPSDEFFQLLEVSLVGLSSRVVVSANTADIERPMYVPGGDRFIYHINEDSDLQVVLCSSRGAGCERMVAERGSAQVWGFTAGDDSAVISFAAHDRPPQVRVTDLHGKGSAIVWQQPALPADSWIASERIDIPVRNGISIPTYLWRSHRTAEALPAAFIRVHGGPAIQAGRSWDRTIRFLLESGFDVLTPNYRGSSGYGQEFERAYGGRDAQIKDIHAVIDYAVDVLNVPPHRIVLYGHSYGAMLAAFAAGTYPMRLGSLVLVSSPRWQPSSRQVQTIPHLIVAFHGANDLGLLATDAKLQIEELFGRRLFREPPIVFRVMSDEGHSFHRVDSLAEVYGVAVSSVIQTRSFCDAAMQNAARC